MEKQLKLDLSEIQHIDELDYSNDEVDSEESILYKNRLKKLIKEIAEKDNYVGIQSTKEGFERLQETSKYLITMLIFETLSELSDTGRKQIKPVDVDRALDKIISKSSAIDIVLGMLTDDIEKLKLINKSTSVNKATQFINNYL